jgi:hypothetical protein
VLKAVSNILNLKTDFPEQRAEYILFQRGFGKTTEKILNAVFMSQSDTVKFVSSWLGQAEQSEEQASTWCKELGLDYKNIITKGAASNYIYDEKVTPQVFYKDSAKIMKAKLMTDTKILTPDEIRTGLGLLRPEDQIVKAVQSILDSELTNWEKARQIKQMRGFGFTTEVLLNVVYYSQMHKVAVEAYIKPKSEDLAKKAREWAVQLGIDPSNILAAPVTLEDGTIIPVTLEDGTIMSEINTFYDRFTDKLTTYYDRVTNN